MKHFIIIIFLATSSVQLQAQLAQPSVSLATGLSTWASSKIWDASRVGPTLLIQVEQPFSKRFFSWFSIGSVLITGKGFVPSKYITPQETIVYDTFLAVTNDYHFTFEDSFDKGRPSKRGVELSTQASSTFRCHIDLGLGIKLLRLRRHRISVALGGNFSYISQHGEFDVVPTFSVIVPGLEQKPAIITVPFIHRSIGFGWTGSINYLYGFSSSTAVGLQLVRYDHYQGVEHAVLLTCNHQL